MVANRKDREHYSKPGLNVSPSKINWNTDDDVVELLPMQLTIQTSRRKLGGESFEQKG